VYNQRNYGFDINARKPLGNFTSVRLDYRLENIKIFDLSSGVSQTIREEAGTRLKSSITAGITYDTRDSVFLTRRGQRVDLSAYVAGGPLGGNVDIYGFDLSGSQYFLLPWDTIFLINGEVASVDNWAGGDRVPIFDRLYLGGANNLRGFRYRKVSPKDENNESIGGKSLARLTFEYTFPVVERVRGAVFYDTGFVNGGAYSYNTSNIASDAGIGLRLDLPIGPVRLDYGIPLQSPDNSGHGGKFNFTIGYQF
jgi:outer membrane protein insertion porin family